MLAGFDFCSLFLIILLCVVRVEVDKTEAATGQVLVFQGQCGMN